MPIDHDSERRAAEERRRKRADREYIIAWVLCFASFNGIFAMLGYVIGRLS